MRVLLSIKPAFAEMIFDGRKRFEFRTRIFKDASVRTAVVYATNPVKEIIGEFSVEGVLEGQPEAIWSQTSRFAGISKAYFDAYFSGRRVAFALVIGKPRMYAKPIPARSDSGFVAPQSYRYVKGAEARRWQLADEHAG